MRYPPRLGLVEQDGVLHYRKQIPDPELRQWLPAPHTGKSAIQRSLGESSWNKAAERKRDAVAVEFNDIVHAAKAAMQAGHQAISDPRFNDAVVLRAVQQLAGELPGGMAAVMDRIINGLVPRPKVEFPRETPAPGGDVSFGDLIDNWALHRERGKPTDQTRDVMTGKFTMLAGFLGHRCGNNITTRDLLRYLEYLLTRFQAGEIKSKTVEDHVSAIRAVFKLAKQKKLLTTNPADDDGFKWRGKTQEKDKRAILTQKEQRLIIISTQHAKPIVQWGHWLGFMGLIVEEFADANVQDVYEDPDTGIWIFDIREDHREGNNRLKVDSRVRRVPLHKAVIEAGFLGYHGNIRKLDPTGPLFPDVSMDKYGRRAVRASRLIMKSIRLLGANLPSLKDRRKVHYSWRHTAITNFDARDDVNVDRARYLMGHDPLDDHAAHYIRRTIITSKETIDKLPSPI